MGVAKSVDERGGQIDQFLDNLRRVVHVLYGHSRRVARPSGMTSAQAWLTTKLSIRESTKASDLARDLHLGPAAVVRVVSRLDERGLVARTRSSNDCGIVKVELTHVARKLVWRIPGVPPKANGAGIPGSGRDPRVKPARLRTMNRRKEEAA